MSEHIALLTESKRPFMVSIKHRQVKFIQVMETVGMCVCVCVCVFVCLYMKETLGKRVG